MGVVKTRPLKSAIKRPLLLLLLLLLLFAVLRSGLVRLATAMGGSVRMTIVVVVATRGEA
jgi:hypothetical protein